jgi:hypothetical protein
MMNTTSVIAAIGLGIAITGIGGTLIQVVLFVFSRQRITARWERFLNSLEFFVLGPQGRRIDHEPMYSTFVAGIFMVAMFWVLTGPLPLSVIFPFHDQIQITLGTCMWVGSGTCMYGVAMGTPFDIWRQLVGIVRRIRGWPPLPTLDIRRAYRVSSSGVPTLIASLVYYTYRLILNTPLSWTGPNAILLSFICLGLLFQWLRFLMESRRITRTIPMLIEQELTRRRLEIELGLDRSERPQPDTTDEAP